ncbi:hypothetical protein [Diaphorobacter sp. MNS-0]|jgi:Flp pilus assembly protein TadB|uniref:hypothetical protein n=1 Tax=Diaphorobacter sp. MNS-0 TaxID=2866628 RepID=UPI001C72FE58|nr:hypothetical protein [Diaphorobacter sp. MNS-0]QYY27515.1 hypothetical protein K2L43_18530 [Diaphorobacter sp. MNS-0]
MPDNVLSLAATAAIGFLLIVAFGFAWSKYSERRESRARIERVRARSRQREAEREAELQAELQARRRQQQQRRNHDK